MARENTFERAISMHVKMLAYEIATLAVSLVTNNPRRRRRKEVWL